MARQGTAASASKTQPGQIVNRGAHVAAYIVGTLIVASLIAVGVALTRALAGMPPDTSPADETLVGALGTVVIHIPESGSGEVTITQPGQRLRVAAQSDTAISAGTTVVVVDVPSPGSVVVAESGF